MRRLKAKLKSRLEQREEELKREKMHYKKMEDKKRRVSSILKDQAHDIVGEFHSQRPSSRYSR